MIRDHERTQSKLKGDLGPDVIRALNDPGIIEIMLNEDGVLWIDSYDGMKEYGRMDPAAARNLINTISSIGGYVTNYENPNLSSEIHFQDGEDSRLYRFQGIIPPLVSNPVFSIRKPSSRVISLKEYLKDHVIDQKQYEVLDAAIRQKQSVLVVGGTGSGKTTLLNALLGHMVSVSPNERIAIIEDTIELQCLAKNKIQLRTSDTRSMDDLLRYCMRMRPDRIVVGEVRGKEAFSLIKAWNTGHPGGLSTVHANTAESGLLRLEQLISESGTVVNPRGIAEAINLVVFIEKSSNAAGRRIKQILRLTGYGPGSGYVIEEA